MCQVVILVEKGDEPKGGDFRGVRGNPTPESDMWIWLPTGRSSAFLVTGQYALEITNS